MENRSSFWVSPFWQIFSFFFILICGSALFFPVVVVDLITGFFSASLVSNLSILFIVGFFFNFLYSESVYYRKINLLNGVIFGIIFVSVPSIIAFLFENDLFWIVPVVLIALGLFNLILVCFLLKRFRGRTPDDYDRVNDVIKKVREISGLNLEVFYSEIFAYNSNNDSVLISDTWDSFITDKELEALLLHEFAHAHRRFYIWGSFLFEKVSYFIVLFIALWLVNGFLDSGRFELWWMFFIFVRSSLNFLIILITSFVKRIEEYRADHYAFQKMGTNKEIISSLEKLENSYFQTEKKSRWFGRFDLFSDHPKLEKRIRRLRTYTIG